MANYNSAYTGAQIDAAVGAVANKADDNAVVHDTGNETIGGVKTFSSFPVTPSNVPTTNYQVANKKYIDDKVKTNVPAGAVFTDTLTTINGKTGAIEKADIVALGIPAQDTVVDISGKVDKVAGKGLSTEDYTTAEKTKLAGIATGANNYTHPANHPPSIITQDASNRFVTDTEKSTWNSKANASHTHTKANITDFPESMPPTSHTHGNISNDGKIGASADLPVFTGVGGALTAKTISAAQALLGIEPGAAKIETGSYTGTGTYGDGNPTGITFSFPPSMVVVGFEGVSTFGANNRQFIYLSGYTYVQSAQSNDYLDTTLIGNRLSWFNKNGASYQYNDSAKTYYYMAIG